ncbi:MAG: C10 family peptidase [Candidatus Marinimicrobia bacterium]|nr:C10 family peptidase [Candidatus Neomarinimicrobiota bacterium]
MKKYWIAFVGFFSCLFATQITSHDAEVVAKNIFFERGKFSTQQEIRLEEISAEKNNGTILFFIVNFDPDGFVIVAGDNRVIPVLGYDLRQDFDSANKPTQMDAMLQSFKEQIQHAIDRDIQPDVKIRSAWEHYLSSDFSPKRDFREVEPFITANWGQGTPWNANCPEDPAGPGGHALVGCVAVAMAQAIYYWEHPSQGVGSHGYYSPYGSLTVNFGQTEYHFENMLNSTATPESQTLLYHCGVAVNMNYGPDGSGAYVGGHSNSAIDALKNYFSYNSDAQFIYKSSYPLDTWNAMVRSEIDAGRPLVYRGYGSEGGHAFNIDGYQSDDYFHVNWGWSGYDNGYFYLNDLSDFNSGQAAIFDLFPSYAVDFSADVTMGEPPLFVQFTDQSVSVDEAISTWEWDFDNDDIVDSYEQNPSWTFTDLGSYTVSLTITGDSYSATKTKENYVFASSYFGPIWHVSATGSDVSGMGSEENPFATIQRGIDAAAEGETVVVAPGTYAQNIQIKDKSIVLRSLTDSIMIYPNQTGHVVSIENSSATLYGFTIIGGENGAEKSGIGIYCKNANPNLVNLVVTENAGGGIYLQDSNPKIVNALLFGNFAERGAGLYCNDSNPVLINSTIADNSADYGGGIYSKNSNPEILNTIVWGNEPNGIYLSSGSISVDYSDIQSAGNEDWFGANCLEIDPQFTDPASGNYSLTTNSPCIDSGTPNVIYNDENGSSADMGKDSGSSLVANFTEYDFGVIGIEHIGEISNTTIWKFSNFRAESFQIDDLFFDNANFELLSFTSPVVLEPFSQIEFTIQFTPSAIGIASGILTMESTDFFGSEIAEIQVGGTGVEQTIAGNLSGTIFAQTYPYYVVNNLQIQSGNQLTIEAGTEFLFTGKFELFVSGTLTAIGSQNEAIRFSQYLPDELQHWGGIQFVDANPNSQIKHAEISFASGELGGGIYCYNSSPTLEWIILQNNSAISGGGIYCENNSNPSISNLEFENNFASDKGGGIYLSNVWGMQLDSVLFLSNFAADKGGGIYCENSNFNLSRSLIAENYAAGGGGIWCEHSTANLIHTTFSLNVANFGGGIITYGDDSTIELLNSILWSDSPNEIFVFSGQVNANYCDIQNSWAGEGNINLDPLFYDPENFDFTLNEFSPCIDTGDPNSASDPDGTIADIGLYYFDQISGMLGDVNNDGDITILDILLTVNIIMETIIPDYQQSWAADINEDGTINIMDILTIVNAIMEG